MAGRLGRLETETGTPLFESIEVRAGDDGWVAGDPAITVRFSEDALRTATITDGDGDSCTATVNVSVTPVPLTPLASDDSAETFFLLPVKTPGLLPHTMLTACPGQVLVKHHN